MQVSFSTEAVPIAIKQFNFNQSEALRKQFFRERNLFKICRLSFEWSQISIVPNNWYCLTETLRIALYKVTVMYIILN